MAFNEKLPKWDNVGIEPPEIKKTEGWQPTEKPPAQWFNWLLNRNYKALEELRSKAEEKTTIGLLSNLTTTIKTNIVDALNSVNSVLVAHKAENTTLGNPHGINAKANKQQEVWASLILQNGWTGSISPIFYKDEFGVVHVQGRIASGTTTSGTTLFTLPVGYRPTGDKALILFTYVSATDKESILATIGTNGEVKLWSNSKSIIVFDFRFRTY